MTYRQSYRVTRLHPEMLLNLVLERAGSALRWGALSPTPFERTRALIGGLAAGTWTLDWFGPDDAGRVLPSATGSFTLFIESDAPFHPVQLSIPERVGTMTQWTLEPLTPIASDVVASAPSATRTTLATLTTPTNPLATVTTPAVSSSDAMPLPTAPGRVEQFRCAVGVFGGSLLILALLGGQG